MFKSPRALAASAALAAALLGISLIGCTAKESRKAESLSSTTDQITVDATDTACTLSVGQAAKGKRSFTVTNNGTKVTEFYVYGRNNEVLAEAENISPGLKRTLEVEFSEAGTYRTACKPGMVGDGISADFTVSG